MNGWRVPRGLALCPLSMLLILAFATTTVGAVTVTRVPATHSTRRRDARPALVGGQFRLVHFPSFGGNDALAQLSATLGAPISPVREYYKLGKDVAFPSSTSLAQMSARRTLVVSLSLVPGETYASVASGEYDQAITAFLQSMVSSAHRFHLASIYFCFQHEPDSPKHKGFGSPAEFKAAWDHVHQIAVDNNLDANQPHGKLRWIWILIQSAFRHHTADAFWPGASETNIVGVDGYNTGKPFGDRPQTAQPAILVRTPSELFDPALAFARKHGKKRVFVTEYGSIAYTDQRIRPDWIHSMQRYVLNHPAIRAVLYWDSGNFKVNSDPGSIEALAAMAKAFG